MLGFVENVLWLLVLIGVMIMIHELGHFWAARFFDVKVEAFSFGFGPRLFGFRRGETDYRFSADPVRRLREDGRRTGRRDDRRRRSARLPGQAALAAPDHRLRRAVHEHACWRSALLTGLYMVKFQKIADADMQASSAT